MSSRFRFYAAGIAVACLAWLAVSWLLKPAPPSAALPEAADPANREPVVPVVQTPAKAGEGPRPVPDLDLRLQAAGHAPPALSLERAQAVARLKQQFPGVEVDFDPVTGSPKWVASNAGLLSGPQAALAAENADAPVRQFIDSHRELFGHGSGNLDSARRVTDYTTARSGSRKVVWHQQLDGIDVFEAVFQANLTPNSELINLGSQMVADPDKAAGDGNRASLVSAPPIAATQAVAAAGQDVGERVTEATVRAAGPPAAQPDRRQSFRAAMLTDAEAKLVWVPMDAATLRLAWDVTISSRARGEMYRILVDARSGGVLVRQALTAYISDASYRIYTSESPTPFSPGHEKPSSLQPPYVDRVLVTTPALNTTASPNGWIDDGGNITSGNNTDAYTDTNADNVADTPRTQGSPARVFDFPMALTQDPSTYKDASVTQLFYWSNFAHDRLYELGFTEAAGNFQINNFGRGGLGNDPVRSEAQDGSGTNNANFSTPVDGGAGRMQMFNWTGPTPDRDGSFEAEVVLHEYCHGLSNRLVGGPSVTISALASRGMGEGWSDFYGLALTAEGTDNPHGNWARAGYSRYLTSSWLSENYYYGARRYSYSTDMLKNPHTFRDIDPTQVDWHTSVPRNPTYAATQDASQVHYVGTIWCVMLWDLRANLILKHGFAVGNERAMFLVAEGMKLGPANPNLVQARDGIVQATLVNHPGDLGEVWTAFAKRGMGQGATAPVSSTTTGITESYAVPDSLEINNRSGWNITGNMGGAFTPAAQTVTLSNDGASTLNWTANPNADWLSASPASGSLAPGANVVVTLTTQAGSTGSGFHSTNVVFANTGTGFNQPIGVRLYVTPPVAQAFNLNTNPGWTTSGEWAFGTPTGSGGTGSGGSGSPDPAAGATGSSVFGVNLAGNHSTAISGPHYLTTAPVDLSARKNTRLRFQRWLNTNQLANTRVTVEVSTDGTTWREVFVNPGTAITQSSWVLMDYDISSFADRQSSVQARWSYRTIASPGAYAGWNIDDVEFLGESTGQLSLDFAATVTEGAAPIMGTVTLNVAQAADLTVALQSSVPTAATVPAAVVIPAGLLSQTFAITPVNDSALDGTQTTNITATAPSMGPGAKALNVTDNETAILTVTAPATVTEGAAPVSGSVSVSAPPAVDVVIDLSSNNAALTVPGTVTIPAGSTGPASFTITAPNNAFAEGVKNVTLTASVSGWSSGATNVSVADDDVATVVLTGPASVREGDGPQAFTVTVNTIQATGLVLNLASSDVTELTVPATVTIPSGQFSANFDATIVNDALLDGAITATLTADAAGYAGASRQVTVADNDVSSYAFAPIASPQKRNKPFGVTVTAWDVNGAVITNHSGTVTLASASPLGPVPFSPNLLSSFSNGSATGSIAVTTDATAMYLVASDGGGRSGTSNSFNVEPVQHDSFLWTGLPSSVSVETFFNATATAKDDLGNTVTGYAESTVVEAYMPQFDRTVGSTASSTLTTKVYNTAAHDSRAQIIYTAGELGPTPRLIGALAFSLSSSGGQAMLNFAIRMKHTNLGTLDGASWEESGWTTVYTAASFSAGSTFCTFIKPFPYNGTQNVMIDVSFNNASASTAGSLRYVASAVNRVLSGTSNSTHGDPLTWTSAAGPAPAITNEVPTLSFYEARKWGPIPASPVAFADGTSTMQAFAPVSLNSAIWLLAKAPSGISSFSDKVVVATAAAAGVGGATLFSDGFETGTLGSSWSLAGSNGATARTQVTTGNTPRAGSFHLTMDTTSAATGTFARNSPTLTLNLAGQNNVSVEWYSKEFSDDNHAPTLGPPKGTFDSNANFDGVAISPDGITWVEVSSMAFVSSAYGTLSRVFLDPVIQRLGWSYNSTFRIRFSQYDDQAIPDDGIAIDDVVVRANLTTAIAIAPPVTITEGAANVPVTVTLPSAPGSDVIVILTSSAPARLSVSASVTVPAGQTSATAFISAPQNQFFDVGKSVLLTAAASGQTTGYRYVRLLDDEQPILSLSLPASVTEGGSAGAGTVTVGAPVAVSFPIFFSSSATSQATVSSFATLSSGSLSANLSVTPVNDTLIDGTQSVTITAAADGATAGSTNVNVLDNENPQIVLTPPPPLNEGGATGVGNVSISGQRAVPTAVSLTSADLTEATVPATVTIPAGQTSINFQVFPVDDGILDGDQTVTLTASAAGLIEGTNTVEVRDDDPAFFEISMIASPQVRNAAFPVEIRATDEAGLTLSAFNATAALSADAGGVALPLTFSGPVTFVNGVWSGNISIGAAASSVTLTASAAGGAVGTSNPFDVTAGGAAVALAFQPVASAVAGAPFAMQVSAVDANGILVNEVSGPVTVQLRRSPSDAVLTSANLTLVSGKAAATFSLPAPLPAVYLHATTGTLTGQSATFPITTAPVLAYPASEVLFTDNFESGTFKPEWAITGTNNHRTIITTAQAPRGTRHLVMDCSVSSVLSRNEATLTLNLAGKQDVALTFWMKEIGDEDHGPPATPFSNGADFDGVAISADGVSWHEVQPLRGSAISSTYQQFTLNLSTLAAARGLTLNSAFKIRFNHYDDFPVTSDGFTFDDITVTANAFPPPAPVETLFSDNFESGVYRPEWEITGTNTHRTVISASESPRGSYHLLMDVYIGGLSRNEATLTVNLSGVQDAALKFWMKEMGDEDNGPPTSPFTNGADFDGVAISADGVSWYEVQGLRSTNSISTAYQEFTVDLSAAAAARGLTLNSAFRIRFNHCDDSPLPSDGFAFDDISITGRPLNQLALVLPASVSEGSSATARVDLASARAVDTVVSLTSNRPASLSMPATITIPAGATTSAVFEIIGIEDSHLTGALPVDILATGPGVRQKTAAVTLLDNDSLTSLTLSLPATLNEGGSVNGIVTISPTPLFDLPLSLSAVPNFGLVFPESITMPAAESSVGFTLAKSENTAVLESAATVLTVAAGTVADSETIALSDNDTAGPLIVSLPGSAFESAAPVTGSVSLPAPQVAGADIVVALGSSLPDSLTVPASVTIPAGQSTASFAATPVNNALQDGSRLVTVTATISGLTNGAQDITIRDDDPHHLTIEAVAPLQFTQKPFDLVVRAWTIENQPATVTGGTSLAAASGVTPVPLSPATAAVFAEGVSITSITFPSPASGVVVSVSTAGGVAASSNAFDILVGPRLAIDPAALTVNLPLSEPGVTRALTLTNPGTETTNWSATIVYPGSLATVPPLTSVLEDFNSAHSKITALIPNLNDFYCDPRSEWIIDGNSNMYDVGNQLGTNIDPWIHLRYTDETITSSSNLGTNGKYFTHKLPGLFFFAADVAGLSFFEITGGLGADGAGSVDSTVLTCVRPRATFKGFVKRVHGAGTPSVNHLIIIEDNGVATQEVSSDTGNDYHRVNGLTGVTRIYYLLYASAAGGYIDNTRTQAIMEAFIDQVTDPSWLALEPSAGSLAASGGSATLTATLKPGHLPEGLHQATLRFISNDAAAPVKDVPVNLNLTPAVHHFEWSAVPSPQSANVPFAATLTARDSGGALISAFNGSATLQALSPVIQTTSGTGSSALPYPFEFYEECRTQAIYLPAEVGAAGRLQSIALDVTTKPQTLKNFTVRLKHTAKFKYDTFENSNWEDGGWTTVHTSTLTVPSTGWLVLPFSHPFDYDGTSNLMVDMSFDTSTTSQTGITPGAVRSTAISPSRALVGGTSGNSSGSPLSWNFAGAGQYAYLPNIRFSSRVVTSVSPAAVTLTNGSWSGSVAVEKAGVNLSLQATHAAHPATAGESNAFTVTSGGNLAIAVAAGGAEGGSLSASVSVDSPPAADLLISLASNDTTEATVPAAVTIPAGQTSVPFTITLPDDAELDGTKSVTISATAPACDAGTAALSVTDTDTTTVTVTLPASLLEADAVVLNGGSVSLSRVAAADLTFALVSSDLTEFRVPATVTIPAGQTSASFSLTLMEDTLVDGGQPVTVTATLDGSVPGTGDTIVTDNESRQLTIIMSDTTHSEGRGTFSGGLVKLSGAAVADVPVTVATNDTTELLGSSVVIPAGFSSVSFGLTAVNDTLQDGTQAVTLTASAPTFIDGTKTVSVLDNDLHNFLVSAIASPQVRGGPINVTFTARDINNEIITDYSGSPVLTAQDGVTALGVTPSSIPGFVSGVKPITVAVQDFAAAAVLKLTDSTSGGIGTSNAFAVGVGALDHFTWAAIPSPQVVNQPFDVSLSARDAFENLVTSHSGSVPLSALRNHTTTTSAADTTSLSYPFGGYQPQNRCQMIYTPAEVGAAPRRLRALAFEMTTPDVTNPATTLSNVVIRLKHTAKTSYSGAGAAVWESTGWTTVFTGSAVMNQTGWKQFIFTTPFDYNGTDHLMVDVCNGTGVHSTTEVRACCSPAASRAIYRFTLGSESAVNWTGTTNSPITISFLPNLRLMSYDESLALTPSQSGALTGGVWSGSLSINASGMQVRLSAPYGVTSGLSNAFDVSSMPAPILTAEPAFTGGLSNTVHWTGIPAGAEVLVERDLTPAFLSPLASPWITDGSHTFPGLTDGATYHYRAQRRIAGPAPPSQSLTETSAADFQAASLIATDATSLPGSVRLTALGYTERFEGAAGDWSDTIFTVRSSGTFTKAAAPVSLPVTSPQLPISADADKEGEVNGSAVRALMAATPENTFTDCTITAQIYPRNLITLNHMGLLARASGSGATVSGYQATFHYNPSVGTPVWMGVSKYTNGAQMTLIPAGAGTSFDPATQHFKMQLSITGSNIVARLWRVTVAGGIVTETLVDTRSGSDSSFASGVCGLYVNQGGVFDDVVITSPSFMPSGAVTSNLFSPANFSHWSTLSYSLLSPAGTAATVDVLDAAGALLAANVASGTDLHGLLAVSSQPSIKLRANLSTAVPTSSPELQDWTVNYLPELPVSYSSWSNIVSSTQDASPPVIGASGLTTMAATAALTGTATDTGSGVAGVTVDEVTAQTADNFANWSRNATGLIEGLNSFTIAASDQAVPPNTSSVITTIYRITAPQGDPDQNGIGSLLEHAHGIPAGTGNPRALLPAATTETEGGQRYLTMDYRRRLQREGLQYLIETSGNLTHWSPAGVDVIEQSVTPTGDGVTETVRVRITPAIGLGNAKFVRLRVVIQ